MSREYFCNTCDRYHSKIHPKSEDCDYDDDDYIDDGDDSDDEDYEEEDEE